MNENCELIEICKKEAIEKEVDLWCRADPIKCRRYLISIGEVESNKDSELNILKKKETIYDWDGDKKVARS